MDTRNWGHVYEVYVDVHRHYPDNSLIMVRMEKTNFAISVGMYITDEYEFDVQKMVGMSFEKAVEWLQDQKHKQRKIKELITPEN